MAIVKISNSAYNEELILNKRASIEQEFAQQVYAVFREIKFGITPCCYVNYESAVNAHFIEDWRFSKSNKTVVSTNVEGIFIEPLAPINEAASLTCPTTPSNVCTIIDLEGLLQNTGTYTQCFDSPLIVWTVTHTLGAYPSVTVVDINNQIVVGQVNYTNSNTITITFSTPLQGCVFLN